ncbi:ChaN family lipoprotein [Geomonas sp. RF6]|uniref:ChaN family lipoprotein n=1 Tax=Geomonas sp. RF6 TaxID=2897342 RepID=UPI001E3A51B5|nr:ChaN family lipoprotein [Geomonas sp. RF6]UFS69316.1 ChaN family lipoprotein [Geomonas sp. RF6]
MKRFSLLSAMILLLFTSICAHAATKVVRVADNAAVDLGKVVEDLGRSDVVFIGDTHDDTEVHRNQLEIIRSLHQRNRDLAIGVEMFTTDSQRDLDDWVSGKVAEKDFIEVYAKNWSYDWRLYRDIFIYARDNRIPLIALNVPKPIMSKVVRQGAKALEDSDRKELPPGPAWTLHPRQAQYLKLIRQQAFGNAPVRFPVANFDEAQALRNDAMAYNVVKFRKKDPKRKVVVIAGTWHAIKNGAPESLKKYGSCSYKVVLPDLPEFTWLKPTAEDVDYLMPRVE